MGPGSWARDATLFTAGQPATAAIATGSGAQAATVYAYDPAVGVYRSLESGAPGSWVLIWPHASRAVAPFLMVDSADPTRLWVSATGGLYRLDGAASGTFTSVAPVVAGATAGLGELDGQVFTTELVSGTGLELQVSDVSGTAFAAMGNLSGTLASVSSLAVGGDGTVYIATAGWGVIVGTPVEATTTSLTSSPNPSARGERVTFVATVTSAAGAPAPGGAVVFWNGTRRLGAANLSSSGVATLRFRKLTTGSHSIVATYQGSATDAPSTSTPIVQTVT